ncbi:hypothetical protein [Rhodoferax saidenbachensis]|uniref:Lipoprotein n=1 Tax=Rhodoferax saidenbachensis TaxID=1484693 RepID=A0ABU1ZTM4_9BURK|nr:hypothetical protein [Rhodoferax saidenbachensis]MDR7308291.1 hypothetical protein [Rhodoferax saidenbachensis]
MHTGPAPTPSTRIQRCLAGLVCGLALTLLGGCADVHWERAFYDGFQRCPPGRGAQNESCGKGPAYDRYEQERERLQSDKPKPAADSNPIEEKQL